MLNVQKVKGRMAELDIKQCDVARVLEVSQPTASQKLNRIRPMDLNEAERLAKLLKIRPEEFEEYFFAQ